jgi:hypothetical protein
VRWFWSYDKQRAKHKDFAGIYLTSSEAKDGWPSSFDHKWFISKRLGQGAGHLAMIIDYFASIQPCRTKSLGLKGWFLRRQEWLLALAEEPETALFAFEKAMRGTRG